MDRFPELQPVLHDHAEAYDSILPHVLMGGITRWMVDRVLVDPNDQSVRKALEFLDESFAASRGADGERIAASFPENLPQPGEHGAALTDRVGPALREHLERFG